VDDVRLNKAAIIERCLRRVAEEYAGNPTRLSNSTHQDAIVLNLERACQAAVDLAMYIVAQEHLGVPQTSAEAFDLLAAAERIPSELAAKLRAMVGFRNVAVHEYQKLNLEILQRVVESEGRDLIELCRAMGLTVRP
jgi:uncharacterized protein YutE (UPF0331/DUF86 family)